jgi:hypothetical protein
MINKDNLYDWLFHYNHYTNMWNAFKRDDLNKYFNGELENILTSKKHSTLVEIIEKTKGDKTALKKLLNDK